MSREYYLQKQWGLTTDQYNEILAAQNNVCAICLKSPDEVHLAIDHDHVTGRIRGLLCYRCNRFLVGRHRDAELVQRIADYLRGGTDFYAPKGPIKRAPRRRRPQKRKRNV